MEELYKLISPGDMQKAELKTFLSVVCEAVHDGMPMHHNLVYLKLSHLADMPWNSLSMDDFIVSMTA